jgi:tetratricopeptide (TPR) repeat protein
MAKSAEPLKIVDSKEKARQKELKTAIDPDVMFMLLTAEIAGQRQQYDVAVEGYLEAAKRANDPRFAERAAVIAMYMKDSPKTQEAVDFWLKRDSKNLVARKIAVLSALRANDKNTALTHLTALMKAEGAGFDSTLLELAGVLQKEGKIEVAYDTLTALSANNPKQASIYLVQALIALQTKNHDLAEQQIQKALAIQPDWDKALMLQAQIALASGDMNKAKTEIKNATIKYPNNSKIKKLYGQLLIKAENYQEAGEVYKQLIITDPKDVESEFTLALVYLQLDQVDKAEEILTKLLAMENLKYQASFYLGKVAEKRKENDKAIAWFEKVTEGEFAFDATLEVVSLLAKDKQYDTAIAKLTALVERFPTQKTHIMLLQAEIYSQQKQYAKAFDLLTTALAEQPEQSEFLYTRALIADRLNKKDVLESDLKQILVKDPNNFEALNALGYSLLDNPKRYAEAETYLQKALQLRPDEAVIIDSYGWLQFKLGHLESALEHLKRAYAKQQENEIAAHIAEVLWVLGRQDEARKIFDEAIKNAPEDEFLLKFQQRILNNKAK